MNLVLSQNFFERPTVMVARELLGKYLMGRSRGKTVTGMITEVEVYDGPHDLASHASKGLTNRTKVMFGPAGYWYVYLVYGMYWMLNIVTREKGYPAAILICGVQSTDVRRPHIDVGRPYIEGPGRITKYFKIDKQFNGMKADKKTGLWIAAPKRRASLQKFGAGGFKIKKSPRVGVDYAGPVWSKKLLRFYITQ